MGKQSEWWILDPFFDRVADDGGVSRVDKQVSEVGLKGNVLDNSQRSGTHLGNGLEEADTICSRKAAMEAQEQ